MDQENKGEGMRTDGLRKERVTLEFEVERGSPPSEWPWSYILSRSDALKMRPGESVRVVEETHFDDLAQVAMERDAAIRERDAIKVRVAELEAASGGEPVAYFVKWADKDWAVQDQTFRTRERAQDYINDEKSEDENPQIVPLYRSPPQPRGWLTGEERRFVHWWAHEDRAPTDEELDAFKIAAKALLARSTPPEVALPVADCSWCSDYATVWRECLEAVRSSLAAAGVGVKEVGCE